MMLDNLEREEGCVIQPVLTYKQALNISHVKEVSYATKGSCLLHMLGFENYNLPLPHDAIISTEKIEQDGQQLCYNIHIWNRYDVELYIYYIKEED